MKPSKFVDDIRLIVQQERPWVSLQWYQMTATREPPGILRRWTLGIQVCLNGGPVNSQFPLIARSDILLRFAVCIIFHLAFSSNVGFRVDMAVGFPTAATLSVTAA